MIKTYEDTVKLLTSAGKFRISLGLDRISSILDLLGNPQDELKFIHVAGTNGKGSVCAILSSILTTAGKKTGLYTSPHIFKYTERIKINQKDISDEQFCNYVSQIVELADKNNIDLTEFEILTAVMFKYFYDEKVEVVVLETGLGGKYDATNVIKNNLCSIITHIDYDHTERLGTTKDEIATEKAGIIKKGCPCIVFEGMEIYHDIAFELGSLLMVILPFADISHLALKGVHQQENLALALATIETVFPEIDKETIDTALEKVKHPCRFQYIKDYNLIIDGAHNPNGINALSQSLNHYYPKEQRRIIFGCLENKDYKKMINDLVLPSDEIYFYQFENKNSCSIKNLQQACPYNSQEFSIDVKDKLKDGKLNIICGSFYMIKELSEKLEITL